MLKNKSKNSKKKLKKKHTFLFGLLQKFKIYFGHVVHTLGAINNIALL